VSKPHSARHWTYLFHAALAHERAAWLSGNVGNVALAARNTKGEQPQPIRIGPSGYVGGKALATAESPAALATRGISRRRLDAAADLMPDR
jgi:hypothetical protein